jgi:hypothetical protein
MTAADLSAPATICFARRATLWRVTRRMSRAEWQAEGQHDAQRLRGADRRCVGNRRQSSTISASSIQAIVPRTTATSRAFHWLVAKSAPPVRRSALPDVCIPNTAPFALASTTLAELLTPLLAANPFLTMRASLRWWSSEEFEDGVAHGGQSWLRRGAVDCFFSALLLQADDAGGRRRRSSS